jgi:opacity protein-like surface antigen
MMKRQKAVYCAFAVLSLLLAGAPSAQAQIRRVDGPRQSIGVTLGYFALRGEESRTEGDVLLADLFDVEPLDFSVKDFNGVNIGGEWLFGLNDYLEGGVGVGFYQRTVPSVYANVVNVDRSEIAQDLKLRVVPLTATVRFLPIGRGSVEPYVGAGIGFFNWKYSEIGEFVDTSDNSVFPARYIASGSSVGPVILGGIRFPVADAWSVGGELRYQKAEGKGLADKEFLDDKIDLGGWTANFTFHLRF